MVEYVPISITGYNKLLEEVDKLEKEADEVRVRVKEAREMGDLKENGEYIYGRQQLGFLEGRLGELRGKINLSKKIDCTQINCDKAGFGTVLTLRNHTFKEKVKYQLLGPNDADIENGSISIHSPIGEALNGLKVGEKTTVSIPAGEMEFEVLDINKSDIQ